MAHARKAYPYDWKTAFGITGMGAISIIASSFMSSYFLVYLTDYAGLGMIGATIAPVILAIGRFVDAVNDPLQGMIIDAAPRMKMGKYKFFILLSIFITALAICCLYSIPEAIKTSVPLLFVWVLSFYLLYDIGAGFSGNHALIQTMGADDVRRSKLMLYGRLAAVFIGAAFSALLIIVNLVDARVGNFGKSFSITTVIFMAAGLVISLPCLLMVKQGNVGKAPGAEDKIHFRDLFNTFRQNRAFVVHFFGVLVRNFVYTFMTATTAYYTKWAYCADITTGEVNNELLGTITFATTLIMMAPMLISAIISPAVLKRLGSNVKVLNLANWICLAAGALLFVLQITGILQISFVIFGVLMGVLAFGNGLCFVPTQTMWLECIDHNEAVTGKPMGGTISALSGFVGKAQIAISTLVVGWVLLFIGYEVDSVTGNYMGALSRIPAMLNWFIVVCALLPAISAFVALFIYRKYPDIKKEQKSAG
ncbi:MAG: MFS transporter [Christensenellales bacterium]|jgi:Na+/melibiose symporter-like transporter